MVVTTTRVAVTLPTLTIAGNKYKTGQEALIGLYVRKTATQYKTGKLQVTHKQQNIQKYYKLDFREQDLLSSTQKGQKLQVLIFYIKLLGNREV